MMAQKFHRVHRSMADKEMLEVCSAIDSDEDRDVVAEVDYTEGRTSEDEVPPQVCKKTAKKSHMTMEPVIRRTTAFNVFCSERLKANPNTGFQPEEWGFEWRTLTDASKKEYEAKAYALRRKNIDVRAILRNINNMTNLLKKNEEEAKSSEIEGVCTIVYKNNVLHFTEFGNLTGVSKNPTISNLIWGHAYGRKADNVKGRSIQELRGKAMAKMSKIAKSQLGLNQFPYERVRKGEFILTGIPPSLMPLQPPGRMTTKELLAILDCKVTVTRAPTVRNSTDTSQTNEIAENTLQQTHTRLVHETSTSPSVNKATESTLQQPQTRPVHESSSSKDNEATGNILQQKQTQLLPNTSTHTNSSLDTNRQTVLLEYNFQMSHHVNTAETCDGRIPGHATEGQSLSFMAGESASEVVQTTLVQDIVAEDPSQCAAEVQTPVVAAIFTAEEPDTEVVQTTLVQDIFIVEDPALEVIQTPVAADIFMAEDPASEMVQRPVVADIFMAEDPASEMVQRPVVADIFVAEDPASQVVQTTLMQDMQEGPTSSSQISTVQDSAKQLQESGRKKKRTGTRKDSAKQQQESGETKQRTGLRTLWTAAEVLLVQQHFSEELAGLKPVSRSSIDSFLEQQTVVKRTSTALGNYLLRNRKKSRPDDQ